MTEIQHQCEDKEIIRTVNLLGGKKILNHKVCSRLEAHDLLEKGLPGTVLEHLVKGVTLLKAQQHGVEKAFGISLRTYQRHKEMPKKRLSPEQSGRAWKFAEILGRAIEIFGSLREAEAWLDHPAMALEQRKPIDLLSTPAGIESVEQLLTRLEYGVYT